MEEKEIKRILQENRKHLHRPKENDDYKSDQDLKKPQPPLCKAPMRDNAIKLDSDFSDLKINNNFLEIINSRVSNRVYTNGSISLKELSYLLWCCQGVKEIRGKKYATLRTVPCGGGRHEFETYLAIRNVEGLKEGFYHYLPMSHSLECLSNDEVTKFIGESLDGQIWANKCSVCFYWSIDCYRVEWRYGIYAHPTSMLDAGHVSENLYLAATSIGLGGCAIGAIDEELCNEKFELDGDNEFAFYAMPIGTIDKKDKAKEDAFYAFVKKEGL